jgi:3-oxoacyl-[acyl-carrier protein] reductase
MADLERGKPRTALVTGASRGIGRAIARRFVSEGYVVIANDITAQGAALAELVSEIAEAGGRCEQIIADVGDPAQVAAMAAKAVDSFGPVDVLVNNAGVLSVHRVEELDPDEWDRIFRVNVKGTFLVTQALLKHFRQRGAGRIINIASIGGKLSGAGQVHYCASKAAVIRFTQGLAMELGDIGITASSTPTWGATIFWMRRRSGTARRAPRLDESASRRTSSAPSVSSLRTTRRLSPARRSMYAEASCSTNRAEPESRHRFASGKIGTPRMRS